MSGIFELKQSSGDKFHFVLKSGNGLVIHTSETYNDRASAKGGTAAVNANAADDGRYERKTSAKGEPYFTLRAANNEVIGTSEMYSSEEAREKGIASVKANGPTATIVG